MITVEELRIMIEAHVRSGGRFPARIEMSGNDYRSLTADLLQHNRYITIPANNGNGYCVCAFMGIPLYVIDGLTQSPILHSGLCKYCGRQQDLSYLSKDEFCKGCGARIKEIVYS